MACARTICSSTCDAAVVEPSLKFSHKRFHTDFHHAVILMGGVVEREGGLDEVCSQFTPRVAEGELGGVVAL